MSTGCCGATPKPRKRKIVEAKLPPNPTVSKGVRMLYLGNGVREFRGGESGLRYHVSDHRRKFRCDPRDVDQLLRNRTLLLEP